MLGAVILSGIAVAMLIGVYVYNRSLSRGWRTSRPDDETGYFVAAPPDRRDDDDDGDGDGH